jgi:hypothetical protein
MSSPSLDSRDGLIFLRSSRTSIKNLKSIESRRWFGARRECDLGDPGEVNLCESSNCKLCSVIGNSFKVPRFKEGISTSGSSSQQVNHIIFPVRHLKQHARSDRFSKSSSRYPKKTVLLTEVIAGSEIELSRSEIPEGGPSGFDSVRGESLSCQSSGVLLS